METLAAGTRLVRLGRLDCLVAEPSGAAIGPPLLLVHGLGGGPWGWENFQRYFAQRGYTSYAVELPGHGADIHSQRAEALGAFSVETFTLYVAGVAAELGACVVIGHSMGGLIAQKLAESQNQPGYVFISSAPPWHMFRRAYLPMWRKLIRHPWRQVLAPVMGKTYVMENSMQDELVNNRLSPQARVEIGRMDVPDSGRASMQMVVGLVTIDASQVASPCLVVGATADKLIPVSEQRQLALKYGCPLQIYDRGHMLILEEGWEEVAEGILTWVGTLAGNRAQVAASG